MPGGEGQLDKDTDTPTLSIYGQWAQTGFACTPGARKRAMQQSLSDQTYLR